MATTVKLYSKELDETRDFDIEHANRIFAYKHNTGWELTDTEFKLQDGIIVRNNTGKGEEANKPGDIEHSGTA